MLAYPNVEKNNAMPMRLYGSDKPDTRFGMQFVELKSKDQTSLFPEGVRQLRTMTAADSDAANHRNTLRCSILLTQKGKNGAGGAGVAPAAIRLASQLTQSALLTNGTARSSIRTKDVLVKGSRFKSVQTLSLASNIVSP